MAGVPLKPPRGKGGTSQIEYLSVVNLLIVISLTTLLISSEVVRNATSSFLFCFRFAFVVPIVLNKNMGDVKDGI